MGDQDNWLADEIESARVEVDGWPAWKRDTMRRAVSKDDGMTRKNNLRAIAKAARNSGLLTKTFEADLIARLAEAMADEVERIVAAFQAHDKRIANLERDVLSLANHTNLPTPGE